MPKKNKSKSVDYLFVKFRTMQKRAEFGEIKGQVIEINPPSPKEKNRGKNEGDWLGFTKMPVDKNLWDRLMTGLNTVNVDNSTEERIAVSQNPDLFRMEGSKYVSLSAEEWKKSPFYQQSADIKIYSDYINAFLTHFTNLTKHIPIDNLIRYYPHAWLFPSKVDIHVGRDGIAFLYEFPERPDSSQVLIDTNKILDNHLLPHPENKDYTCNGPNRLSKFICDDEHYVIIRGDGSYVDHSRLGNPGFLIFEKRYHGFWSNMILQRGYGDGTYVRKHIKFVEIFGDIGESNFTIERARTRAQIYAEKWIAQNLSDGKIDSVLKLRSIINDFKNVIADPANDEHRIENFFDQQPWILERGFGCKRYHSQVTIKQSLLSRSNQDIRPDKFLERNDGFCDILDLKRPDTPLVIKKPNRAHASAKLIEAEAQVDTYVNFVKEPKVRDELQRKGIKVLSPKGIVLIGRTPSDLPDEWEDVKDRLSVKVLTYDDLVGQMDLIVSWIEELLNKSKYQA